MQTNKLREALAQQSVEDADTAAWTMDHDPEDMCEERTSWDELCSMTHNLAAGFNTLRDAVKEFLDTPPKNGEVGTPADQATRFHTFCQEHSSFIEGMCRPGCPFIKEPDKCHCLCKWLQMPYEKGSDQ